MRAAEVAAIERGDRSVRPETAVRFSQALRVGLHQLTEAPGERAEAANDKNAPTRDPWQPGVYCFDVRLKRNVVASLGRWEDHIEPEHAEVAGRFDAVELTIREPQVVTRDVKYDNGENYYRMGALPGHPAKYLKVCVSYRPVNVLGTLIGGWVVTAYPTRRIKRGEEQL